MITSSRKVSAVKLEHGCNKLFKLRFSESIFLSEITSLGFTYQQNYNRLT